MYTAAAVWAYLGTTHMAVWRYAENRVKKLSLDIPASERTPPHNNIDYRGDFTV